MTTQLTPAAYSTIANNILSNLPDERESYTVEVEIGHFTLFADVDYNVESREAIGGSFEGVEFEIITETLSESIEVTAVVVYDNDLDEEYFATPAQISELKKFLN